MKKSNKLFILLLTLIFLFTLTACSKDSADTPNGTVDDITPVVTEPVNNTVTEEPENTDTPDEIAPEITDAPDNTVTEAVNTTDTPDLTDTPDDITSVPEDEGNFSLTNFIGCWESATDPIAIVIDAEYNWQACTKDEVFTVGYITVDYGTIYLYQNIDDTYYCSLVYIDKAVTDEFGNIYNFAGPVEEYIPAGYIDISQGLDASSYSLLLGKYYCSEDDGSYIEISEGLNYEMYSYTDGYMTVIDCGYLEKKDDAGYYTVYPTMYIDEEPYEIFEFDTGVLSWNSLMYCYSDEEPSSNGSETAYTLIPGTYFCLSEDATDYYIVITEDFQYESYGPTDWSDESSVFDDGYITATDEAGVYIKNPTMYIDEEPMKIYVTEDGLLHWGLHIYEHGSDPAEG